MRARSLLLTIPTIWIVSTLFTKLSGHPWTSNGEAVTRVGEWIVRFQKDQNRLPESLAEVRLYAYSFGEKPDIHDSYGERFFYQPLTEVAFLVKSFGRDATENTVLRSHDESYSHGLAIPPQSVKGLTPNDSRLNFYQSSFLEGLQSPRGPLVASLQTRFHGHSKRLLIQSREDAQFFMSSVHDSIDEFIWMPGGYEIIFTAQGSQRYEDGIYYWNLRDNGVKNLLPMLKEKFFPKMKDEQKMLMSLSHVSEKPDFLYFFAFPAPESGSLDPMDFYRYNNFYALNPLNDYGPDRIAADRNFSIFEYSINPKALIDLKAGGTLSKVQKDWLALSLSGDRQSVLEMWQTFCSTHSESPALPYALWWLASIYNDTYRDLLKEHAEKARTLRNFGLELADALSLIPSAPLYLREFAEHIKKNLLLSKAADYNVTLKVTESDEAASIESKESDASKGAGRKE